MSENGGWSGSTGPERLMHAWHACHNVGIGGELFGVRNHWVSLSEFGIGFRQWHERAEVESLITPFRNTLDTHIDTQPSTSVRFDIPQQGSIANRSDGYRGWMDLQLSVF